jgi:hypothetical protein
MKTNLLEKIGAILRLARKTHWTALTIMGMLGLAARSSAAPPVPIHIVDSGTTTLPCGVTVQYVSDATWFALGSLPKVIGRLVYVDWHTTFTNPDTGVSVELTRSGTETRTGLEMTEDGYFLGYAMTTSALRIIVPGQQPFIAVGRVSLTYVFDPSGNLVDIQIQPLTNARSDDDVSFLCSVLAP